MILATQVFSSTDTIWVLLAAALVFFMQAGFAMVETGFTRAKNAGNILMKNLMDFSVGSLVFWMVGFGLMFGVGNGLIGELDFFVRGDYSGGYPTMAFLIFQTVFCATAATIVSGAMAERTKFSSYLIYSIAIALFVYPISGHWIWGGGWLAELGFHDFAGSTVVHMVGGVAALVGAKILGPRIGKYSKSGKVKAIPGHSLTLGALGVFILWFGWFGFNGGSTVAASTDGDLISMGSIFMTTNLAASAGAVSVMIITWLRYKKPDVSLALNGALAGLVGITAGTDVVSNGGAVIIGILAGIFVVFGIELLDKKLKIDDPVGAVAVHGICGALGTIMVGFLSTSDGLFYGGGFRLLGVQVLGVVTVALYVAVVMAIIFLLIKKTVGLRVSPEEELAGLDVKEHGLVSSYADFMPTHFVSSDGTKLQKNLSPTKEEAVPVTYDKGAKGAKISKVVIITNKVKFDTLKDALSEIGVTGITVTNVLGSGMQRGGTEYYRGVKMDINLLPKVKIDIVVCKVPVQKVVEIAKTILFTGNIGDGKIFVYNVENVIKVRTGEEGLDALQDIY